MELPGAELVEQGIRDLSTGQVTVEALLVSIAAPRLSALGRELPTTLPSPEVRLYELLAREDEDSAHGRYNALVRRLVSYERAAECELADGERIGWLLTALGAAARDETTCYLTGESTAVLLGWRHATSDVDIRLEPEDDDALRKLASLKNELRVNVELASPADFIPLPDGWRDRSPFVAREGKVVFRHFDLISQALSKLERGHARDLEDVAALLERGLVERESLLAALDEIEPELYRFPAIDPRSFRARVEAVAR